MLPLHCPHRASWTSELRSGSNKWHLQYCKLQQIQPRYIIFLGCFPEWFAPSVKTGDPKKCLFSISISKAGNKQHFLNVRWGLNATTGQLVEWTLTEDRLHLKVEEMIFEESVDKCHGWGINSYNEQLNSTIHAATLRWYICDNKLSYTDILLSDWSLCNY